MSKIEWTDTTWNPVTGCTKVSAGCKNCYAETFAGRGIGSFTGGRKFTDVFTHADRLDAPLRWRKPRRVFVNSMSDLFHEFVPDEFIDQVFAVMAFAREHAFQVLTKRPQRMLDYLRSTAWTGRQHLVDRAACQMPELMRHWPKRGINGWPLPNVWLGVSCEDQRAADERIPLLLQTPAAVRFVSAEPLLGPIDFKATPQPDCDRSAIINWVIVGGESGPGARPCDIVWVRSIVEQCKDAGVAAFVKQLGALPVFGDGESFAQRMQLRITERKGGDPSEWPADLRVRQFPEART